MESTVRADGIADVPRIVEPNIPDGQISFLMRELSEAAVASRKEELNDKISREIIGYVHDSICTSHSGSNLRKKLSSDVLVIAKALRFNPKIYDAYISLDSENEKMQYLVQLIRMQNESKEESKKVFDCITNTHRYIRI
jgi:hypothetical protein